MKKNIYLFFFALLSLSAAAQAVTEDSIDYIYIGVAEKQAPCLPTLMPEKVNIAYPQSNPKNTFHSTVQILRLLLDEKSNKPLKYASYPTDLFKDSIESEQKYSLGLTNALIEGLKRDKMVALCLDSLEYRYSYARLLQEIANIEGKGAENRIENDSFFQEFGIMEQKLPPNTENIDRKDWADLGNMLDIVVEKGFSARDSRPYFRILYLRLVWYKPEMTTAPRNLTLIPYHLAAPYLAKMYVKMEGQTMTKVSVLDYFTAGLFSGYMIYRE